MRKTTSGSGFDGTESQDCDDSEEKIHDGKTQCPEQDCGKWVKSLKSHRSNMHRKRLIVLQVCDSADCLYQTKHKSDLARHKTLIHS
jgi:uncharacterized protein YaaR (DUF327 family)